MADTKMIRMSPVWELDENICNTIDSSLIKQEIIQDIAQYFYAQDFARLFENIKDMPYWIALHDSMQFIIDTRKNVFEALCYIKAFDLKDIKALWFERNFLEMAFLCIYSSMECLAVFLQGLFNITNEELKKLYKNGSLTGSLAVKVGAWLRSNKPESFVTDKLIVLKDPNIKKTISFRNDFVHNQRIRFAEEPMPLLREDDFSDTIYEDKTSHYITFSSQPKTSSDMSIKDMSLILKDSYNLYAEIFIEIIQTVKDKIFNSSLVSYNEDKKCFDVNTSNFKKIKLSDFDI